MGAPPRAPPLDTSLKRQMAKQVSNLAPFKTPLTQRGEFQLISGGDFRVIIDIPNSGGRVAHRGHRPWERAKYPACGLVDNAPVLVSGVCQA
jgi:hypothetical protein